MDVHEVPVVDNGLGLVNLQSPETGCTVVKVLVFSDFKRRIIHHDTFQGSYTDHSCMQESAFYREMMSGGKTPGKFKCRNVDCGCGGGGFINATIFGDLGFASLKHNNLIATERYSLDGTGRRRRRRNHDFHATCAKMRFYCEGLWSNLCNRFAVLKRGELEYSKSKITIAACIKLHTGLQRHLFDPEMTNGCDVPDHSCKLRLQPDTEYGADSIAHRYGSLEKHGVNCRLVPGGNPVGGYAYPENHAAEHREADSSEADTSEAEDTPADGAASQIVPPPRMDVSQYPRISRTHAEEQAIEATIANYLESRGIDMNAPDPEWERMTGRDS